MIPLLLMRVGGPAVAPPPARRPDPTKARVRSPNPSPLRGKLKAT